MSYIGSNNIEVFPAAGRIIGQGKYTSENNLTGILRALSDQDSFVIDADGKEFVIHGYYFKSGANLPEVSNLYAHINVESNTNRLINDKGGTNLDDDSNFLGLWLDDSPSGGTHTLQIKSNGVVINRAYINIDRLYGLVSAETKSLTEILAEKQDKIDREHKLSAEFVEGKISTAGTADNALNIANDKTVSLTNDYNDKLVLTIGDRTSNVTVGYANKANHSNSATNAENSANATNATTASKLGSATVGATNQLIYLNNGVAATGKSFHIRERVPSNGDGNNGDIWFKYN